MMTSHVLCCVALLSGGQEASLAAAGNQNDNQELFLEVLMSVTAVPQGLTLKSEQETLFIRPSVGFSLNASTRVLSHRKSTLTEKNPTASR